MVYKMFVPTLFSAYILDLILGDPQWKWHPVRLVGKLIENTEQRLNVERFNKKRSGVFLAVITVASVVFCAAGILKIAGLMHPFLEYIVSVTLIYFALSIKSLHIEARKVYKALEKGNPPEARKNLSMIVARDTRVMNNSEIIRASVETIAESAMDGIVAPLFYALIGGPILVWGYKAVNTLDSMVGYRNERFIEFGSFSAKLDAIANFVPAKITCLLIGGSACLCRKKAVSSFKWTWSYFLKGPEENSQAVEAAMAGALGVQLGGLNFYNSTAVFKPFIGDNIYPLDIKHIKEGIKIVYITSFLFLLFARILTRLN